MRLDAVRQNPLTKRARNTEVEEVIKDWLRTASSRSGIKKLPDSGSVTPTASYTQHRNARVDDSDSQEHDIESD